MAVVSGDSTAEEQQQQNNEIKPKQRNSSPGVRVVGGRIYDSRNGKTCHQCRQKTMDVMSVCNNLKKDNKPCVIQFCHKCLLNRYGEKADEVATLEDWRCPKCRGICNCSFCMKKRGCRPTGILVHTAKATGYTSVSEMLQVKGSENIDCETVVENENDLSKKTIASNKGAEVVSPTKRGKENIFNGTIGSSAQPLISSNDPIKQEPKKMKRQKIECSGGADVSLEVIDTSANNNKSKKMKREGLLELKNPNEENGQKNELSSKMPDEDNVKDIDIKHNNFEVVIPLPHGSELTALADTNLPPEEVGSALQFLEFCATFGKPLDLKKGQAEAVLRDLVQGRTTRRGKTNVTAQFLVDLLSVIEEDQGGSCTFTTTDGTDLWFKSLKELIFESPSVSKNMGLDFLNDSTDGFDNLSPSKKLKILNFFCDEVLETVMIRSWIDDENSKCAEKAKEAKGKVSAAKEEEKRLKQKIKDSIAAAIISKSGAPISISEHDAIVSQVKCEAAEAHAGVLESKGLLLKCNQIADAVRTEPIFLKTNGQVFWRLKCYSDKSEILLQELGTEDVASCEKWYTFDEEQKEMVEKHINSSRQKRHKATRIP